MGFRPPASPTAEEIHWFNDVILLPVIIAIVVFVMSLLVYVIWRFSEKRNPTPSKTTHNTAIEVLWTAVPVMILFVIAIPSFKLLYFADRIRPAVVLELSVSGSRRLRVRCLYGARRRPAGRPEAVAQHR
ncbi:MAG: cytochrome c oxidase subunit II transmembrane domain-containing protein [Planctomycetota bacterium]